MDLFEQRRERLRLLINDEYGGTVAAFVRRINQQSPKRREKPLQDSYVNRIVGDNADHRKNLGEEVAREFELATGKPRGWLDQVPAAAQTIAEYVVLPEGTAPRAEDYVFVENNSWRGSCGGGKINWEARLRKPLAFQRDWLTSKGVTVPNALLIYADGDSMKDFIVDGDIVLFDRSNTRPASNAIFAIEHPEGTRIKRIRIDYDGSIVLSSDNPDKTHFPDDRVPATQAEQLRILGAFVWRGGG